MTKVRIYEIKSGAASNAPRLLSKDGQYFYWNAAKFGVNQEGDTIFVVNPSARWALYTIIGKKGIPATFDSGRQESHFNHEHNHYSVSDPDGRYDQFIRFNIKKRVSLPRGWGWTTIMGSSEVFDLWRDDKELDSIPKRLEKIEDLSKVFPSGDAQQVLQRVSDDLRGARTLLPAILNAIQSEEIQGLLQETDFHFQLAQDKLQELREYPAEQTLIDNLLQLDIRRFNDTLNGFGGEGSPDYDLLKLIGELIAYIDYNAANKISYNQYPDHRILARSTINQNFWIKDILQYKKDGNDVRNIRMDGIRNALLYLEQPSHGATMLSEQHRKKVAERMLQKTYNSSTFIQDLTTYFEPYGLKPANPQNLTRIFSSILYHFIEVKKLWSDSVEGLLAYDQEKSFKETVLLLSTEDKTLAVVPFVKSPKGGKDTLTLLNEALSDKDRKYFYLWFVSADGAKYRLQVRDYAKSDNYHTKHWEKEESAHWKSNFADYQVNGQAAEIVYLVDEAVYFKDAVPLDSFKLYEQELTGYSAKPLPYEELLLEDEPETAYLPPNTFNMNVKENITKIHQYIESRSFKYKLEEVANFYLSLRAKPFVILAGISGTGKTQLPRKFAEAAGFAETQRTQVAVRPDWTDGTDLLGYVALDKKFVPKDLTSCILNARNNPDKPYFFILDEMNLARVEHYFSDFLSVIETRERKDGKVTTDDIIKKESLEGAENKAAFLNIKWPTNLYLIGTVNMDETTHAFSRKVLDRANSIEMNDVDLGWLKTVENALSPLPSVSNAFMETTFISSSDLTEADKQSIDEEMKMLMKVNTILQQADLHFAYRVRDEVAFYLILNKRFELMPSETAMDFQLVQKVLPRIHGSSERIQSVLIQLFNELESKTFRTDNFVFDDFQKNILGQSLKYHRASSKIIFMLKRFEDDRFTSFWL